MNYLPNPDFLKAFDTSYEMGLAGEEIFKEECARRWPSMKVEDVSMDKQSQSNEIDFILTTSDGRVRTVELKTDLNDWSENLFIEVMSNKEIGRKGWFHTTLADIIVYFYINGLKDGSPNMLWIEMSHLRQVMHNHPNLKEKHAAAERQRTRAGMKTTVGKLLPRKLVTPIRSYNVKPRNLQNPHSAQGQWRRDND